MNRGWIAALVLLVSGTLAKAQPAPAPAPSEKLSAALALAEKLTRPFDASQEKTVAEAIAAVEAALNEAVKAKVGDEIVADGRRRLVAVDRVYLDAAPHTSASWRAVSLTHIRQLQALYGEHWVNAPGGCRWSAPLNRRHLRILAGAFDRNRNGQIESNELALADDVRRFLDRDGDGQLLVSEVVLALEEEQFVLTPTMNDILPLLVELDDEQDGYVGLDDLDMCYQLMRVIDHESGGPPADQKPVTVKDSTGREWQLGRVAHDGRISIVEIAQAVGTGRVVVGSRFVVAPPQPPPSEPAPTARP